MRLNLIIVLLVWSVCPVFADTGPDQMQPVISGYASLHRDYSVGQGFVPQQNKLRQVKIFISSGNGTNKFPVRLSVHKAAFDSPALGASELPSGKIDARGAWHAFDFKPSLNLVPGKLYYLRLDYAAPEGEKLILPASADYFLNLYPAGDMVTCWKGKEFRVHKNQDIAFKTYGENSIRTPAEPVPRSRQNMLMNVDYSCNFIYAGGNNFGSRDPRAEIIETLENAKANGFDGVNWRVSFMGEALYRSKIARVVGGHFGIKGYGWMNNDKSMAALAAAIQALDPIAVAVEEGHRRGLKVYAWVTLNDFGTNQERLDGFLEKNPHYQWVSRDGTKYLSGTPCYAEPEMRKYTLSQLQELMQYGVDGLFVSTRGHTTAFRRPTLLEYGFNAPFAKRYRELYGIDIIKNFDAERDGDRLIRLRAEMENELYRELKSLRDREFPQVKILADISQLPQDFRPLVSENLIDELAVNTFSGSDGNLATPEEYRELGDYYKARFEKLGKVKILMWLQVYSYRHKYQQDREIIQRDIENIRRSSVDGMIFHEHCAALSEPEKFWSYIKEGLK